MDETNFATGNDLLMLFAQRVKEYRLAAQLSQKELAALSGVSQATISHFEQGVYQKSQEEITGAIAYRPIAIRESSAGKSGQRKTGYRSFLRRTKSLPRYFSRTISFSANCSAVP